MRGIAVNLRVLLLLVIMALIVAIGVNISQWHRINTLESIVMVRDSLETCKQAVIQRDNAIKAWQSTAYNMLAFNAGDIDADSMLSVLQFNFKPGSGIIDLWLRSISSSKESTKNKAGKAKRN